MAALDVVICGAGAGGLTLAHALGRQGRRVLIVDKQREPHDLYKGELLQPRSLEILEALELLPPLMQHGALKVDRLTCCTAEGAELVSVDYRMLPKPFDYGLVHYYKAMNEVFAAQLNENVEFLRGASVQDLIWDSSGRVAGVRLTASGRPREVDARLTVACDGRASRIRSAAGIDVSMHRYKHQLVAFDIGNAPDLGRDMTMHLTGEGLRVTFQLPGGRARLYVQIAAGGFGAIRRAGLTQWVEWLLGTVPALAALAAPLRVSRSNPQLSSPCRFNSPTWTRPGLVLLGDAAHCVHPMAGQGMNAAIGDAWTLGEQLAEAGSLTPAAVDLALHRYEAKRRPQIDFIARTSRNLTVLFTSTSLRTLRPYMLWRNRENRRLRYVVTHNVAGFGAKKFTLWDLLCASGIVSDPRAHTIPSLVRTS